MDLQRIVTILLRRWWLVLGMPALVLAVSLVLLTTSPYVASMRATVLIPNDTQETGNAERPELMVLDDVTQVVTSLVFANAISAQLQQTNPQYALPPDEIQAALSVDYYSRVVTIRARRDDDQEALAIIEAVRMSFQDQVNSFLIAPGDEGATIRPVELPSVQRDSPATGSVAIIIQTLVALAIGCGLAALAAAFDQRIHSRSDLATVLPVPVLGDLRPLNGVARNRWRRSRKPVDPPPIDDAGASPSDLLATIDEPVRALRATLESTWAGRADECGSRGRTLILASIDRDDQAASGVAHRLGTVCGAAGERCLVIDAVPTEPPSTKALSDWLAGEAETPAPLPVPDAGALLQSISVSAGSGGRDVMRGPRWDRALTEACTAYDVVLIAARPVVVSADALALARHVDGVVFLVRAGRTGGSALVQARAAVQAAGGSIVGTVLIPAD